MNVFTDLHHADLYYSLHLLFEHRLGWELYRPIGLDWFHQGFWKIAEPYGNAMDTVGQYLDINEDGWDQFTNLNGTHYKQEDTYHAYDPTHDYYQKAITLEKFKAMQFDLIVSTVPAHDRSFAQLQAQFQTQAKHVAQMGNIGQRTGVQHVMHTTPYTPKPGQNCVTYHQEIDMQLYSYQPPNPDTKKIFSMVNCLPSASFYHQYDAAIPEVEFRAYGASCPHGALPGTKGVAIGMREANIGWHIKPGDGFGHTAMGWFASGRPVVTRMQDVVSYGADAPWLFEPGVTCIDIGKNSLAANVAQIRDALVPEKNLQLAENAKKRFHEVVNYDKEEQDIRQFFERVFA